MFCTKPLSRPGLFLLACLTWAAFAVCDSPCTVAQDSLNAQQKQTLSQAQGLLRKVDTNVRLAVSTAGSGTGKLTGSRAKLTKVRLGNSSAEMDQLETWLKQLPATNADVKALSESVQSLKTQVETIEARLAGKPVPAPDSSSDDAPATQPDKPESTQPKQPMATTNSAIKLGYQQQETLQKATYNLSEVESNVAALNKLVNEFKPIENQQAVPYRQVKSAVEMIANAQRKFGWATDHLKQLPANGQGVGEVVKRAESAQASLKAAADYLLPLNKTLSKLVDPASYPKLAEDRKRLQALSQMFANPMVFQTDLSLAAETVQQAKPALDEAQRIAETYAVLIAQQSPEGKQLSNLVDYLKRQQQKFMQAADQQRNSLPQVIDSHLDRAGKLAQQAVADKKPLFFTGGIPQELDFAHQKIELLQALDPAAAKTANQKLSQTKTDLKTAQRQLAQQIIQQNQLPADNYRGDDRKQAIEVAIDAWKHQQQDFQVLAQRIPGSNWNRETMWQYSNGTWYFVDRSKLQVQLIVADHENDSQAIIRPITIIKDHQKGDQMIGVPLWSFKDDIQPSSYLLRSRIK